LTGPARLLAIAALAFSLAPALIADAAAAGIAVYVARPVFAMRRDDAAIRRRDTVREAIAAAFDASCRPAVTLGDRLDALSVAARRRLVSGDSSGLAGMAAGSEPEIRDIVAAAIFRRGRGYRVRLAAFNLKTGRLHGTAEARAPLAGIEKAAAKAARKLRGRLPCPQWRGEIIVSSQAVSAFSRPGYTRKGRIEWTVVIEIGKGPVKLTGRYEIAIESRRCALDKPEGNCVRRRLKGTGIAGPGPGASTSITVTGDGRYRIVAGDAVARTPMLSVTCRAEKDCRRRTLVSDQLLAGATAEGRQRVADGNFVGAAIVADTKVLKKTMSWNLRAEFD